MSIEISNLRPEGNRRFGKARVSGCRCDHGFTCGECLKAAPPWHYTPTTVVEQVKK